MRIIPVAVLALLALAAVAIPTTAASPAITLSSPTPYAGPYTMKVTVTDYTLKPLGTTPGDAAGQGHIHYLVKPAGATSFVDACTAKRATCAAATDYATPDTQFSYTGLLAGDVVAARLARNDHSSLSPDAIIQATVVNAPTPALAITSGTPKAGTYAIQVSVSSYDLKPLGATPGDAAGQGHIHYLVKTAGSSEFKDACSAGRASCSAPTDYATPATSFTYRNLVEGDVVAARLARNDHSSLSPDVIQQASVISALPPTIILTSAAPKAGDALVQVSVSNYQLKPLGSTPGDAAGQGHIHYLVKTAGTSTFVDACTAKRATCNAATDYATPATSFQYRDLQEGDVVGVRLVRNDHTNLSPDAFQQQSVAAKAKGMPAAGILFVIGLLGVAMVARRAK